MSPPAVPHPLLEIAAELLPGVSLDDARLMSGQFHDVVLVPDVAAVRVARWELAGADLPRRTELLSRLAMMGLPFEVPTPLGPVTTVNGRVAVAMSWLRGAAHPRGSGDPVRLRALLDTLASTDVTMIKDVLDEPHAYAGRGRWADLLAEEAIPRLPARLRAEARRRVQAAMDLEEVPASLVHGDLAGTNMHWSPTGELIGVLDWDFAQLFDPAVDVACLAVWHGWEAVRSAVDAETYRRARVWCATFKIEQIASAVMHGEPPESVDAYVERVAHWLENGAGEP